MNLIGLNLIGKWVDVFKLPFGKNGLLQTKSPSIYEIIKSVENIPLYCLYTRKSSLHNHHNIHIAGFLLCFSSFFYEYKEFSSFFFEKR